LGLFQAINSRLSSLDFMVRHRETGKDFTRDRCLTFIILITFLLNLLKRSQQDELDEFFKLLNGTEIAVRVVTKSAFSQSNMEFSSNSIEYRPITSINISSHRPGMVGGCWL
jgi:hypothetical protein